VTGVQTCALPICDNGLSGKKLLLDHYGPRVPIGGTALSGKDFWKPDRAGTEDDKPHRAS
jgi:S-adenosylmethionine synthetase